MAEFRKRGRPRKTYVDLGASENVRVVQESAFPVDNSPADPLNADAEEKRRVAEAAGKIPEIFTPDQVKWCFDTYVAILCFVYSLVLKTDFKALQTELEFTEEQKDAMAKPLARICSKYAPSSWAGMSAEIELIAMLGVYTVSSFQRAKNVAAKEEEKKKDAGRTQPVAPMPRARQQSEVHVPA
jgi:hypothetical protein